MIDYSTWKEKKEYVANLFLDDQNPRFTNNINSLPQNELINEMIDKYKIYELAKSIATEGYFPDKNLIVVKEKDKLIVLEGNRRLSALKCLLKPEIVSNGNKSKFVKLKNEINVSYIQKVSIVIAPSRVEVNPILFKEHTSNTVMPWSRIMKAEFYIRLINSGISIDQLVNEYNQPQSDINNFLRLHYMYNIASSLKYDNDEIQLKVEDKQNFKASTLERIFNSDTMRKFLRISFDEHNKVRGNTNKNEFEKAYKKIVTDIAENVIDSRSLNLEKDIKNYSTTIADVKPKNKGSFSYEDFIDHSKEPEIETPQKASKRTTRLPKSIIPSGIVFNLKAATNLHINFKELKKLPVKTYPNTVAIMLRTFLDKSLRKYLKKINIKTIPVKNKGKNIDIKLDEADLGEIIDFIVKRKSNVIEDDNVKKVLKKFKNPSEKESSISLSALNSVVHNEEFTLSENDIRKIWTSLEGVFGIILTEPSPKNKHD